jgi:hypothetical protein
MVGRSLFESRIFIVRFLVLYRQVTRPDSLTQSQMIEDVIGPGLANTSYLRYINAFG